MKICIVTSVHPALDTRIFHKEARALRQAGHEVVLIGRHKGRETIDGVEIIPLATPHNRLRRMASSVFRALRLALCQDAQVYHFHDPELIPLGLILKLVGRKVIYDAHEDVPQQLLSKDYLPALARKSLAFFFNLFEKNAARYFDCVITATQALREKFQPYNAATTVVRNFASLEYVRSARRPRDAAGAVGPFKMIFIGTIYDERGLEEAVKAVNLLPELDLRFLLYGAADRRQFLERLRGLDALGRLDVLGPISYPRIYEALAAADVGFICDYPLQRHMEGLPVKMFEYMAAGLPIIASDFPVWRGILQSSGCACLVDPLSPEQIAEAIRGLYSDPDRCFRMGERAKESVRKSYNWETESAGLLEAYDHLAGRSAHVR